MFVHYFYSPSFKFWFILLANQGDFDQSQKKLSLESFPRKSTKGTGTLETIIKIWQILTKNCVRLSLHQFILFYRNYSNETVNGYIQVWKKKSCEFIHQIITSMQYLILLNPKIRHFSSFWYREKSFFSMLNK